MEKEEFAEAIKNIMDKHMNENAQTMKEKKEYLIQQLVMKTEFVRLRNIPHDNLSKEDKLSIMWVNRLLLEVIFPENCPSTPKDVLEKLQKSLDEKGVLPHDCRPEFTKKQFQDMP